MMSRQGIWPQYESLSFSLLFYRTHSMCTLSHTLRHTVTHAQTHTNAAHSAGQENQSWTPLSMSLLQRMHFDREPDSPQHPREPGISSKPMQPTARSTKPPFGKETAPNSQSSCDCQRQLRWLFKSYWCWNSFCSTGAELSSSVMVWGVWLKVLYQTQYQVVCNDEI